MNKWFLSSSGTGDLALTVKGLLLALVPLSVTALQHYGVEFAEADMVEILNAVFAAISAVMLVIGLVRKAINNLG